MTDGIEQSGFVDDGDRPWLSQAEPYQWDDGDEAPRWECPDCGYALIAEARCPECEWFDRETWDQTLEKEGMA